MAHIANRGIETYEPYRPTNVPREDLVQSWQASRADQAVAVNLMGS